MLQFQYLGLSNLVICIQEQKLYWNNNLSYQIELDTNFEFFRKYYLPTCYKTAEVLFGRIAKLTNTTIIVLNTNYVPYFKN
jgi:hypothetical protein